MTKKLILAILTSWLLFSSLYLPAYAETGATAGDASAKSLTKKSPDAQFLDGKICLEQGNIPCVKMALAFIPNISPYAKILDGALAMKNDQAEQALLALLPLQADESLIAPAKLMLHHTLAQAFESIGDTQQAIQHWISAGILLKQNQTDNSAAEISAMHEQIWQQLRALQQDDLIALRGNNTDSIFQGWIDLTLASRHLDQQSHIANWRTLYPDHPAQPFAERLSENITPAMQADSTISADSLIAIVLPIRAETDNDKLQAFKSGLEVAANLASISSPIQVYYLDEMEPDSALTADYFIAPELTPFTSAKPAGNIADKPTIHLSLPLQDEANSILALMRRHHMQHATIVTTQHEASKPILASLEQAWSEQMAPSGFNSPHVLTLDEDVLAQPVKLLDLKSQIASQLHEIVILAMPAQDVIKIRPYLDISTPTITFSEIHDIAFENDALKLLNALRFVDIPFLIASRPNSDHFINAAAALKQKNLLRWFALGADSLQLVSAISKKNQQTLSIDGLSGHYQLSGSGEMVRTLDIARFNHDGIITD